MPDSLDQFLSELGSIEKRLDQFIAVSNTPMQLPTLPSIPSLPSMGTTFRSPVLRKATTESEADRLSAMLLVVKQDIQEFLQTGDLCSLFKYAKINTQSELQFVESTLRLISARYAIWSPPVSVPNNPQQLAPYIPPLHTSVAPPSSSRHLPHLYSSSDIRDKIKQVRIRKR